SRMGSTRRCTPAAWLSEGFALRCWAPASDRFNRPAIGDWQGTYSSEGEFSSASIRPTRGRQSSGLLSETGLFPGCPRRSPLSMRRPDPGRYTPWILRWSRGGMSWSIVWGPRALNGVLRCANCWTLVPSVFRTKRMPCPRFWSLPMLERKQRYLDYLQNVRGAGPNTLKAYASDLLEFENHLRDFEVPEGEVSVRDLRSYIADC